MIFKQGRVCSLSEALSTFITSDNSKMIVSVATERPHGGRGDSRDGYRGRAGKLVLGCRGASRVVVLLNW